MQRTLFSLLLLLFRSDTFRHLCTVLTYVPLHANPPVLRLFPVGGWPRSRASRRPTDECREVQEASAYNFSLPALFDSPSLSLEVSLHYVRATCSIRLESSVRTASAVLSSLPYSPLLRVTVPSRSSCTVPDCIRFVRHGLYGHL